MKFSTKYVLVITWIAATVALATWWLILGLRQSQELHLAVVSYDWDRYRRMLLSEGVSLIVLVATGGISLVYFMRREQRHLQQIKEFFASYTHDLKTSLASLRIQAEALQEDLGGTPHQSLVARLASDTVRLELQLENSLYLAQKDAALFLESVSLSRSLARFRNSWPEIQIELKSDCRLQADSRALESIFKNLIQNAIQHGGATRVDIDPQPVGSQEVCIRVQNNGRGFSGDPQRLKRLFVRHNSRSGSGVGLYLADYLVKQMQGRLDLKAAREHFVAEITLRGALV